MFDPDAVLFWVLSSVLLSFDVSVSTAALESIGDMLSDNSEDNKSDSMTDKGVGKNACVCAENSIAATANDSRARWLIVIRV
jgi:hypothetical protein